MILCQILEITDPNNPAIHKPRGWCEMAVCPVPPPPMPGPDGVVHAMMPPVCNLDGEMYFMVGQRWDIWASSDKSKPGQSILSVFVQAQKARASGPSLVRAPAAALEALPGVVKLKTSN